MRDTSINESSLRTLLTTVFALHPPEQQLTILFDIPGGGVSDSDSWRDRRAIACQWYALLRNGPSAKLFKKVMLGWYENVGSNNNDLPATLWVNEGEVHGSDVPEGKKADLVQIVTSSTVVLALTEFSATAPLKIMGRGQSFKGASMPGFSRKMIPALSLDYEKVDARVREFKNRMDRAEGISMDFGTPQGDFTMYFDLRFRTGHASGGLMRNPGMVGNLPSGEAYIVPYEGENPGEESKTKGTIPVQFEEEIVLYRIEKNRATEILSSGEHSSSEMKLIQEEPAYGNIAEVGIGVLGEWGIEAVGCILLDEKLGPHIAFGRSEHFGGITGPSSFRDKKKVVHIDRVYVPSSQPKVKVHKIAFQYANEEAELAMQDGKYLI